MRDLPRPGTFRCSDERLNRIWETGAYTVQLNMQEYLWDGIKRDRLVWIGDMGPEVSTICAVFGETEVVPRSLDFVRDVTPDGEWMNGACSYSMWWVILQEDWWLHYGRRDYLEGQRTKLTAILKRLASNVGENGEECIPDERFLDWSTSENNVAIHAGLQALMLMTFESGERLSQALGDTTLATLCARSAARLRNHCPPDGGSKEAAALLSLAGLRDTTDVAKVLEYKGTDGLSTFYGFYILQALANAGDINTALDFISQYWGAMLDFGATSFWEEFDLAWTKDTARIDVIVPPGKKDLHGDFGAYCYVGFRRSLCHGWASGPTAWLSQYVLGVQPLEPGCKRVRIRPQLGRLAWVEGTYPTPLGPIKVRLERQPDGTVKSQIDAPPGIIIER
jgi:alpha-L-rhamnosidase